MNRTKIEGSNWPATLADAVSTAKSGDVIEVPNWYAAQMGHAAAERIHGEEHGIAFECVGRVVDYLDADDPPPGSGFDEDGYPVS